MADERWEYRALRAITFDGRLAYNAGDGLMGQVVADLDLQVGVDVEPARSDVFPRPDDDAPRAEWVRYATTQGMPAAEVDDLTRDALAERFPPDGPAAAGDLGDDVPGGSVGDVLAWVGDDEARAVLALEAERGRDRPRAGVTEPLERLLTGGG